MKSIKELKDIKGKRILIRVDFNVPMVGDKVSDDFRIKKSVKTIEYLSKKGAKVILLSHLGDGSASLISIFKILKKYIPKSKFIKFPILSQDTENEINNLKSGEVVLLENLRSYKDEKENKPSFGRAISRYGDLYVNDAFSVSHRVHASVVGIPKYIPSYAGFQMIDEVNNLSKTLTPRHPFLFILGGVKFETKLPLLRKFINKADNIFIGGALANTVLINKGYEIGQSIADRDYKIPRTILKSEKLILPKYVVVDRMANRVDSKIEDVCSTDCIVDVSMASIESLKPIIDKAKLILWNGPIGWSEKKATDGTYKLLKILAASGKEVIIGGGNTVESVQKLKLEDKFTFVSTGGGATLEFLSKGTLPGIKALR